MIASLCRNHSLALCRNRQSQTRFGVVSQSLFGVVYQSPMFYMLRCVAITIWRCVTIDHFIFYFSSSRNSYLALCRIRHCLCRTISLASCRNVCRNHYLALCRNRHFQYPLCRNHYVATTLWRCVAIAKFSFSLCRNTIIDLSIIASQCSNGDIYIYARSYHGLCVVLSHIMRVPQHAHVYVHTIMKL